MLNLFSYKLNFKPRIIFFIFLSIISTFIGVFDVNARVGDNFFTKQNYYRQLRESDPSASRESIIKQVNEKYPDGYINDSGYFKDSPPVSTSAPAPTPAPEPTPAPTPAPAPVLESGDGLSDKETEAALEEASDLARDTRTDEEIAATNQKALDDATGGSPKEEDTSTNNILGIQNNDLRNGNVDMDTIPKAIVQIINVLLGVAGTISIVSLMYHAVKMQINSGITGDSSGVDHAKKGMIGSIIGFVLAIMAWFIVIRFIEILSGLS